MGWKKMEVEKGVDKLLNKTAQNLNSSSTHGLKKALFFREIFLAFKPLKRV